MRKIRGLVNRIFLKIQSVQSAVNRLIHGFHKDYVSADAGGLKKCDPGVKIMIFLNPLKNNGLNYSGLGLPLQLRLRYGEKQPGCRKKIRLASNFGLASPAQSLRTRVPNYG